MYNGLESVIFWGFICLVIMFTPKVMVIKMSSAADGKKTVPV